MSQLALRLLPPLPRADRSSKPAGHPEVSHCEPPSPRSATLARLRALVGDRGRIGVLPPPEDPEVELAYGAVSTGVAGLDRWLRGWPVPGPTEIVGGFGAGRMAPILPLVERLTRQGRSVLFVDPLHQLHPPGLGLTDLSRLVLVRPPGERAAWVAEQVARSGAVDALVVLDAPAFGRGGVRLARAAEAGGVPVFVLAERPDADLPAALRLEVEGWDTEALRVRCTRSRDGRRLGDRRVRMEEAAAPVAPTRGPAAYARVVGVG